MDRIHHVKIVTPDPEAVDRFLHEIVQIPEGYNLGDPPAGYEPPQLVSPGRDADGNFTVESVMAFRGANGEGGRLAGDTRSRQFQLMRGDKAHIWGVAIGTRDLEGAHARCVEAGIPCTEPVVVPMAGDSVKFFFAEVAGLVFEVLRVEGPAA